MSTFGVNAAHWFLVGLIFNPKDGGGMFLQNVSSHTDYTTLCPRMTIFISYSGTGKKVKLSLNLTN
jgi:hypothetical protein